LCGQQFKDHVISIINPAITERKIIADLQQNLSALSKTINKPEFQNLSTAEKVKQLNNLLKETAALANTAQETAAKSDITASIGAGINTIIQKIIPSTQNSNSNTQSSPSSSSSACPTP